MRYDVIYSNLIGRGQTRASTRKEAKLLLGKYVERHHIIPEHFYIDRHREGPPGWLEGNPEAKENIVFLTPEEHFTSHLLLIQIYPDQMGLRHAAKMMCSNANGRVSNKLYGWLRRKCAEATSIRLKGKNKHNDDTAARVAEILNKLTKEQREELLYRRDILKQTFKEIHEWTLSIDIDIFYRSLSRIYKREKRERGEHVKKIPIPKELHSNIIAEHEETGITFDEIVQKYSKLYHAKSFQFLKRYIFEKKRYSNEIKNLLVDKVLETKSYKETLIWAKEELGIDVPYTSLSAIYNGAGHTMPHAVGYKKSKRKWSRQEIEIMIGLRDSGLTFDKVRKILLEQGIDMPSSTIAGTYSDVKTNGWGMYI